MPSVVNLGQFTREQPNSGLHTAIQEGLRTGEQARSNKAREQISRDSLKNEQSVSLAKQDAQERSGKQAMLMKVHDKLETSMAGKSDTEIKTLLTSDSLQALAKEFKANDLAELVDEGGMIKVFPPEKPYEPKTREEKIAFEEDLLSAKEKVKANQPLDVREIAAVTNSLKIMRFAGLIDESTLKELTAKLQPRMETLLREGQGTGGNPLTQGLSNDQQSNDPLGLF